MAKIFSGIFLLVLLSSCYDDNEEILYGLTCDTSVVTYTASIKPVLASYCISCHSGGFPSGNVKLDTYTDVRAVALNGRLYGSISHTNGFVAMPPGTGLLSDCTIARFRIWINNGSPNN
ncbi:MAG TPA: hypothetical protein VFN30_11140 [Chitinophagaceae bacterium]|nr:hypothetical protein [Chitinophagaceae bacterium]